MKGLTQLARRILFVGPRFSDSLSTKALTVFILTVSTYPQLNADEKSQFTQAVLAEPGISQKERNLINKAAAGTL